MKKILLLEDDRLYNETLKEFLEDEGFIVDSTLDPLSAYDLTFKNSYDLYIFDINLPFEDGLKALKSLRESSDLTPTIFITSREDKESLLSGLEYADDYLKKPIDLDELLARVNVILRRYSSDKKITLGKYLLDLDKKKLYLGKEEQNLTLMPYELLVYFINNQNRIVSYDELYSNVWSNKDVSYATLRVYISTLKSFFGDAIENIRGVGYLFDSSKIQ